MKQILFLSLLVITLWSCNAQSTEVHNVQVQEFKEMLAKDSVQLVDVRSIVEYQQGHIKGASLYNIRNTDFETNIEELDKNRPVLVYCRSGVRSARACNILIEKGFTQVYNLEGGFVAWEKEE
ncbi:MAG: rhodanese-like domain-containing protein [Cytophagales bacterium]|nr:rhodanese-like domain-containing protein [Cytophagales bacterium]